MVEAGSAIPEPGEGRLDPLMDRGSAIQRDWAAGIDRGESWGRSRVVGSEGPREGRGTAGITVALRGGAGAEMGGI